MNTPNHVINWDLISAEIQEQFDNDTNHERTRLESLELTYYTELLAN